MTLPPSSVPATNPASSPTISVIVPVYKVEKYLRACVDSILAQTFEDFEVILVDDGSPDKSGEICDEYRSRDARVRVIHKANGGVSAARNDGVDAARGEWIMFVDSDDMIAPYALETLFSHVEADVDLVEGARYISYDRDFEFKQNENPNIIVGTGLVFAKMCGTIWCIGPICKIIRKCLFKESRALILPKWIVYGEDQLANLQLAKKICKAVYVDQYIYLYFKNSASATGKFIYKTNYFLDVLDFLNGLLKVSDFYIDRVIWRNYARTALSNMFFNCSDFNPKDSRFLKFCEKLREENKKEILPSWMRLVLHILRLPSFLHKPCRSVLNFMSFLKNKLRKINNKLKYI
ncbi:MAG: glycosyltransferase [Opitutales bacterium]|nr:glycosyltransferase [Opitutales bacterium]